MGLGKNRTLNPRNRFLKSPTIKSWSEKLLLDRGLGLEASGVLFHHFIRFKNRKFDDKVLKAIRLGMLRALPNPAFEVPIF